MELDKLAKQYLEAGEMRDKNAAHHLVLSIVKEAASNFPRDNPEKLAWYSAALQNPEIKWFAAQIIEKVNPVPKALLEDLVLAALLESNPSSNRKYVLPCVKTFGESKVKEIVLSLSTHPEVIANNGVEQVLYWVKQKNV